MKWEQYKKQLLKDPATKAAFDDLELEYQIARAVIEARLKKNLTQAELAHKLQTKQSVVSRVENSQTTPTVTFLKRLAEALDMKLDVRFK